MAFIQIGAAGEAGGGREHHIISYSCDLRHRFRAMFTNGGVNGTKSPLAKTLILPSDNQIGDAGVRSLAAALEKNSTLRSLNLSGMPIWFFFGPVYVYMLKYYRQRNSAASELHCTCKRPSRARPQLLLSVRVVTPRPVSIKLA